MKLLTTFTTLLLFSTLLSGQVVFEDHTSIAPASTITIDWDRLEWNEENNSFYYCDDVSCNLVGYTYPNEHTGEVETLFKSDLFYGAYEKIDLQIQSMSYDRYQVVYRSQVVGYMVSKDYQQGWFKFING